MLSFTNWMTSVTCMTSAVIIFQIYNTRGPGRTISQLSIISDLSHRYPKFDKHKTELCIIPYNPVPCPYSLLLLIAQLSSLLIKPKAGYHPPSCIPPLHSVATSCPFSFLTSIKSAPSVLSVMDRFSSVVHYLTPDKARLLQDSVLQLWPVTFENANLIMPGLRLKQRCFPFTFNL